ncbi:MAG: response regulator [Nitrospirota bacterium]
MKIKILLVSDNKNFLMYLGLLLRRLDFRVMVAEKKTLAYKFVKIFEPDLILIDAQMKMVTPSTFIKHLKKEKKTSGTPIIVASGDPDSMLADKYKSLGCYEYFLKPLKINKLYQSLQNCFFLRHGTNRRHLRTSFNGKVTIVHNGIKHRLYTETLSEGGMYVWKKEPIREGSEVDIRLPLKGMKYINIKGSVIYMKRLFSDFFEPPPGMAIEFKGLTKNASRALEKHILDLIAEDILRNQEEPIIER